MTDAKSEIFLYLTTTGWKTGKPHEIEIWFVEHAGRFYLCAEYAEQSHWVQNLRRHPALTWRVEDQHYTGRARIIPLDEFALLATLKTLFDAKYEWSDGLLVELAPL